MLQNCIAVASGKGGVLKTTISTHVAGLAAAVGWRVLLVDCDPQGNAAFDLGFRSDEGAGLASAIAGMLPISPVPGVRPRLDVVGGGPELDQVGSRFGDPAHAYRLLDALRPIGAQYDLVIIDSPAREMALRRMILTSARYVLVPTGFDRASRVGLIDAARSINEIRSTSNSELDVLAVIGGPLPVTSSRMRVRLLERLNELIRDDELVCRTIVRSAPLVAEQCREQGLLTHEYARIDPSRASDAAVGNADDPRDRALLSKAAAGLATDWTALVDEVLARFIDESAVELARSPDGDGALG